MQRKSWPFLSSFFPFLIPCAIGIQIPPDWEGEKQNENIREALLTLFVTGSRIFRRFSLYIINLARRRQLYREWDCYMGWREEINAAMDLFGSLKKKIPKTYYSYVRSKIRF